MPKIATSAPVASAPAAKPALKGPGAKKTPPAPKFTAAVGDVVVFGEYETEQANPLLVNGDYVRITEIDKTKKNRVRFHVVPITGDENGNERPADTAFAEELATPNAEQQAEIDALLAQVTDDEEDLAALGETADETEESDERTAAQARLTELCGEQSLNPEDYPDWASIAAALAPPSEEDEQAEDVEGLGVSADAGDGEAQARLTELCTENGLDPEQYENWSLIASALTVDPEPAAEAEAEAAPAPAKGPKAKAPGAKATPAKANGKKTTTPKAPKLTLTPTMERVLAESNNDLLAAMQTTEKQIGQSFLDLGGLIKLGELQNAHLSQLDDATGKPVFEDSKKGYYAWVAANLETEERVSRHLAKIYQVFVAKLKFEPEGLIELGISRLREIAPIALKLAKEDKEANAANKAAGKAEDSNNLEGFLQEAATLTVRDVVAKVRAVKAGPDSANGTGAGNGATATGTKVVTLTYRLFEDKAAFVKTCLEAAMTDLPDAEKNMDNALFRIFSEYAGNAGLPAYTAPKAVKAGPAKVGLTKAAPAPVAKVAPKPAPAKVAPKAIAKK